MDTLRIGDRRMIRLDPGDEAIAAIQRDLDQEGVGFAFISAAGAVKRVKLGYWNAETRSYEYQEFAEQLEVLVLQGNASLKEGKPYLHLHAVFGRPDFSTIGGHVVEADVYPTLEVWVRSEERDIHRQKDQASGLAVLALDQTTR